VKLSSALEYLYKYKFNQYKYKFSVVLPFQEEVWQACEEGSYSHEETANSNEPGPVQLRPKMADHSQEQQVTCKKPQHYSSQESQIINTVLKKN
jgi:hypothetical protein